jgi:hypothetical protein
MVSTQLKVGKIRSQMKQREWLTIRSTWSELKFSRTVSMKFDQRTLLRIYTSNSMVQAKDDPTILFFPNRTLSIKVAVIYSEYDLAHVYKSQFRDLNFEDLQKRSNLQY